MSAQPESTAERLRTARRLIEWWLATNPPEDRKSQVARDSAAFLRGESVDVQRIMDLPDDVEIRDGTMRPDGAELYAAGWPGPGE